MKPVNPSPQSSSSPQTDASTASRTPGEGNPAEQIRLQIDAGFSGVEKARQMQQVGSRVAATEAVEDVRKIIGKVRALLPLANFTESQLGVVNKKIQALKDAAERVSGAPK